MLKIITPILCLVVSFNVFAGTATPIPVQNCAEANHGLAVYTDFRLENNTENSTEIVAPAQAGGGYVDRTLLVHCSGLIPESYGAKLQVEIKGTDPHPTEDIKCKARARDLNGQTVEVTSTQSTERTGGNGVTIKIQPSDNRIASYDPGEIVTVSCSIPSRAYLDDRGNKITVGASSINWIKVY